jgi:hypothetical protein
MLKLFIKTLENLGYTDDSGNPLPTSDNRYSIIEKDETVIVRLSEGVGGVSHFIIEFIFDTNEKFINHCTRHY